jgi:hypothetical protein
MGATVIKQGLYPPAARDASLFDTRRTQPIALTYQGTVLMYEAPKVTKTLICPNCGAKKVRRSRRRGLGEALLHVLFFVSPFRCGECYERFFRFRLLVSSDQPTIHHAK